MVFVFGIIALTKFFEKEEGIVATKSNSRKKRMPKLPVDIQEIRRLGALRLEEQGTDIAELARGMIRGLLDHLESKKQGPKQQLERAAVELPVPGTLAALFGELCHCPKGEGRLLKKGETLFGMGQIGTTIFLIREGIVKLSYLSLTGKRLLLEFRSGGDLLGERALASDTTYEASAIAATDVRVCEMAKGSFIYALERNPNLALELCEHFAEYILRRTEAVLRMPLYYGAHERIAYGLLMIAERVGEAISPNVVSLKISLSRKEIAEFAGVSNKTTIRTLSKWFERGWIRENGKDGILVIQDLETLRTLASRIWLQR